MQLGLQNREQLYGLGAYVPDEFDNVTTKMNASWSVEHTQEDGHGDVTAWSVWIKKGVDKADGTGETSSGNLIVEGDATFEGGFSAEQLFADTVFARQVYASKRMAVAPVTVLTKDLTAVSTTITVKDNNLSNNDIVFLSARGNTEWLKVISSASGVANAYVYVVTRNYGGAFTARAWNLGDGVVDTGTTNSQFIDIYTTSGIVSGTGPSIVGNFRTGTTYNNLSPRWAVGNLNGLYGYAANTNGAAFGDPSNTNITIDATNGIRIRSGTTDKLKADTSGGLTLTGDLVASTSGVVRAGATAFTTGTGWWLEYNGGTPRFRIGDPSANYLKWDGTTISLVSGSGKFIVDSSGVTLGDGSSFSSYTSEVAVKFARPSANHFGQSGDHYGVYSLPNGSDEDLYVDNTIKGDTSGSGKANIYINSQGWDSSGGGHSVSGATIRVRSEVGNSTITLSSSSIVLDAPIDGDVTFNNTITLANEGMVFATTLRSGAVSSANDFCVLQAGLIDICNTNTGTQTAARWENGNGVVGSVTTNGTTTSYNTSSSAELKNDLGLASDASRLLGLKIRDFTWKSDDTKGRGVFAQEAYDLYPEAVTPETKDQPWMVDYSKFTPDIIVLLQQHEQRLQALEGR